MNPAYSPAGAFASPRLSPTARLLRTTAWLRNAAEAAGIDAPEPAGRGAAFLARLAELDADPSTLLDRAVAAATSATTDAEEVAAADALVAAMSEFQALDRGQYLGGDRVRHAVTTRVDNYRAAEAEALVPVLVENARPAFEALVGQLTDLATQLPDEAPLDSAPAVEADDLALLHVQSETRAALRKLAALTPIVPEHDECASDAFNACAGILDYVQPTGAEAFVTSLGDRRRTRDARFTNTARTATHGQSADELLIDVARGKHPGVSIVAPAL